jgi:hypothetical protein
MTCHHSRYHRKRSHLLNEAHAKQGAKQNEQTISLSLRGRSLKERRRHTNRHTLRGEVLENRLTTNRHELIRMMQNVFGRTATKRRHSAVATELRPGDQAQFVRLHQARMSRHDAHAEAVGAAFGRGNASLVNVIPVCIGLAVLI